VQLNGTVLRKCQNVFKSFTFMVCTGKGINSKLCHLFNMCYYTLFDDNISSGGRVFPISNICITTTSALVMAGH
jgi:hypothetical protein